MRGGGGQAGGGRWPLGIFPKIHPIWRCHPSQKGKKKFKYQILMGAEVELFGMNRGRNSCDTLLLSCAQNFLGGTVSATVWVL